MKTILFLCTGNSARSIMAEAIMNREGAGRVRAFSAGSQPRSAPHPAAVAQLSGLGYDLSEYRSKTWDEFAVPGAPEMDFIVTTCDSAAAEPCPIWPGHPVSAHWGLPDPAAAAPEALASEFSTAYRQIRARVLAFLALALEDLSDAGIKARMAAIGEIQDLAEEV